jgi:adenylate cyclase
MGALLLQSFIHPTPPATDLALELSMVALALAICLRVGNALLKVFLMVVVTVVFLVVCQLLFTQVNLLVNVMSPLFCLVATGSYGVTFLFAVEQFERRRTRNLLERYVSKNVANTILQDSRSFEETLRGRRQPVTILFSDIRGFTSMTESSDADKLVAQLNEYFSEMVGIVHKESGTLQKFIGDAIMAGWGDTHSDGVETDAKRGVLAALQMRPALAKLNASWKENPDRRELSIGIGVNHGEVIVGNIGTQARTEFTVLGDGVNLAARLETATKQFHTDILIGETVEALTREQFVFRKVGAIAFKGKTRPVETFTLLSDRSQPAPAWLAAYHEAIQLFRGRQFDRAGELFKGVLREIGGQDHICEMYIGRCAAYVATPPPEDWNGAFTLTEK